MKERTAIAGMAIACLLLTIPACQSKEAASQPAENMAELDPALMQQYFEEGLERYGAPNEEHAFLARRVGLWKANVEMFSAPGMPADTAEAEAHWDMIMDGRYLVGEFRGEFNGNPFQGAGLSGYDRIKQKHFATWIDSWSTMLMTSEGERVGNTITYHGPMPDIIRGVYRPSKTIERMVDDDTLVMEMYETDPSGQMHLTMRITYTRAE